MSENLATQIGAYVQALDQAQLPVTLFELTDRGATDALAHPVDTNVESAQAKQDQQRRAASSVRVLWEEVQMPGSDEPARWSRVAVAVAAAIVVIVGAVVVTDGYGGDVATELASAPTATAAVSAPSVEDPVASQGVDDSLPSNDRSVVPEVQPVFRGAQMSGVTAGGPGLVAVGSTGSAAAVWTSVDGITWSRVPHDEAVFGGEGSPWMSDVAAGGPGLVAVGGADSGSAAVWTSVDGIAWSRVSHDEEVFGGGPMAGVIVGGPGLVAVGSVDDPDDTVLGSADLAPEGSDAAVWTSVDGVTWSRVPHDEEIFGGAADQWMGAVIVGGPGLVAVGSDGQGYWAHNFGLVAAVWTSVDGIAWSRVAHDEAVFGRRGLPENESSQGMISVAAGGPGLVAVGSSWNPGWSAVVWTSVDGVTWSRVPHDEETLSGGFMIGVAAGGPGLVAVGGTDSWDGAAVWTSVDGVTWSRVPDDEEVFGGPADHYIEDVIVGGRGLVAVGGPDSAAVWTSVDGVTWSRATDDGTIVGEDK